MNNITKIIIAIVVLAIIIGGAIYVVLHPFKTAESPEMPGMQLVSTTTTVTTYPTKPSSNPIPTGGVAQPVTGKNLIDPEDISLKVGQTGGTEDVSIFFRAVLEDSRCANDVRCIQAGRLSADLEITGGGKKNTVTLNSDSSVVFGDYKITIAGIQPNKYSTKKISSNDYRVVFNISPIR